MPEAREPEQEPSGTVDEVTPLSNAARIIAGVFGFSLVATGAVSVFTTSNQAGSAALILVGAVFLFMLLSGNPLEAIGHGDTQFKFARARRRRILDDIREVPPEEANRALEVLRDADPGASRDPAVAAASAQVYEELIYQRLRRLAPDGTTIQREEHRGARFDFLLNLPGGTPAGVEVKFRSPSRLILVQEVRQCIGMAATGERLIMVANRRLSQPARAELEQARVRGIPIDVVLWRDEQDDEALKSAITSMAPR